MSNEFSEKLQTIKYSKLSELKKVELLEDAVLNGTVEDLKTVIENCKSFEFTAKALGLACLYGGYEKVKVLVDNGVTFDYSSTPAIKGKYKPYQRFSYYDVPADYSLMIAYMGVNTEISFINASVKEYHFGMLPDCPDTFVTMEERAEIIQFLLKNRVKKLNTADILYFSLLWGCDSVANILLDNGIEISDNRIEVLSKTAKSAEREEFLDVIVTLSSEQCLSTLTKFSDMLKKEDKQIILLQRVFDGYNNPFWDTNVFQYVIENTDISKLTKSKLLEGAVSRNAISVLEIMINAGWLNSPAKRDKLIDYARENKYTEAMAWLMDYKNRTADLAKESTAKQAKMMRELTPKVTEKPGSVAALKKLWTYKKLEDGTLQINKYKGNESEVVIPDHIGKDAVSTIGMANSYESIFDYEYGVEKVVTSVIVPDSVTTINDHAFCGCRMLEKITIGTGVTSIGLGTFEECTELKSVTIPFGVSKIGQNVFKGCTSLTDIILPDSVTEIEWNAFDGCTSLTSVTIPNGVKEIGGWAFAGCTSLINISIPDSVTSIDYSIFNGCTSLTSLTIPAGVESINPNTFEGCTALASIEVSQDNANYKSIDGVLFDKSGKKLLKYPLGKDFTDFTIPYGITEIGPSAFKDRTSLTSIIIPDSVTKIGPSAFEYCINLASIELPVSVTKICESAFSRCSNLVNIKIPDGVTRIESHTFANCINLASIEIPDGVTKIGSFAFKYCKSLGSITIPNSVVEIESGAFNDCIKLKNITIPDSVSKIEWDVFKGCTSLTCVTIPNSITDINKYTFSGCTALADIIVPDSVKTIAYGAFMCCSSLTSITIPDNVLQINSHTFDGCSSLKTVYTPSGSFAEKYMKKEFPNVAIVNI